MSETEIIAALREINELIQRTLARFDVSDTGTNETETSPDTTQGVNDPMSGNR